MDRATLPPFARRLLLAVGAALALAGCGTTRPLPVYETPLARAEFQTVRTTAYTHTEADHTAYGNHNALGGILRAAAPGAVAAAVPPGGGGQPAGEGGFQGGMYRPVANAAAGGPDTAGPGAGWPSTGVGSAAADWSRWPAGTVFRLAATGQVYQVDDYGWALAGRNTIDLYQPTVAAMNAWGTRRVDIQVLRWGDPADSLRMLRRHQEYRHIHRMVLELEGRARAAAALE